MEIHSRESVWDVVADNPEEAANLKLRSQLMDALESYIGRENITQAKAAEQFGVPRSRVSELVNGRISKFTIDRLVNMASRAGMTIRLTVESSARPRAAAGNARAEGRPPRDRAASAPPDLEDCMDNPWPQLPTAAPYVLPQDQEIVEASNAHRAGDQDYALQDRLLPEPFIGDPGARVYLLSLNPGYTPEEDDRWHADPVYRDAIRGNLRHRAAGRPFYFFDPRLRDAPGARWWWRCCRWLIHDVGIEALARGLFCVELFPYHSQRYKPVPKASSPDRLVPSSAYAVHLVRRAMQERRLIVAMRAFGATPPSWRTLLPELETYGELIRRRNPRSRSVALSPTNLDDYDRLVRALKLSSGPGPS